MTIYPFAPAIGTNFTFNPVLDNVTYQATITWNVFRQNWYLNLYNLSGILIVCRAVTSSDDTKGISNIAWDNGVVTVTATFPHFLTLGTVVNLNMIGNNPTGYNGVFACDITGPTTFTYLLTNNPGQQVTLGYFGGIVDLTHGFFDTSALVYYTNNNQFVTIP